jgi:hypothetical protein
VTGDRHYAQGAGETETKRGTDGNADVRAPLRAGTGDVVLDAGTTAAAGATATATAAGAAAAEATKQQVRVLPTSECRRARRQQGRSCFCRGGPHTSAYDL